MKIKPLRCHACHTEIPASICECCGLSSYPSECPICGAQLDRYAMTEDQCGSEMNVLLARLSRPLGNAVLGYLTLCRPATQALRNCRALRIIEGMLELHPDETVLVEAISRAVDAARELMGRREWKIPKSGKEISWLKTFLKDVQVEAPVKAKRVEAKSDRRREAAPSRQRNGDGIPANVMAALQKSISEGREKSEQQTQVGRSKRIRDKLKLGDG